MVQWVQNEASTNILDAKGQTNFKKRLFLMDAKCYLFLFKLVFRNSYFSIRNDYISQAIYKLQMTCNIQIEK